MNILVLVSRIPYPLRDGGAIHTYQTIMGYVYEGHRVSMLAINTHKHHIEVEKLPQDFRNNIDIHTVELNTNITPWGAVLNLFSNDSYNISRFYSKKVVEKLSTLLSSQDFDIVHLDTAFVASYIPTIRETSTARIVLKAHNVEHFIWKRMMRSESNRLKRRYLRLLTSRLYNFEKNIINQVDAVVTISDFDRQVLKNMGCQKPMFVSPVGVDTKSKKAQFYLPTIPSLCFIASLDWIPNIEGLTWFLEQVWDKIQSHVPQANLYIAGRNMPASIHKLKMSNVHVIGEVSDADEFKQKHGILIVPLLSGSGMRVKIIEAMALGKAIVSTRVGAEGIEVINNQHMILADAPQDFANAVIQLIKDPVLHQNLAHEARKFVEQHHNKPELMHQLSLFYLSLLPSKEHLALA